jgi:hypothetical protein
LGGRDDNEFGKWAFVSSGEKQGWVNTDFVQNCK